jgi:hypothetical protein
LAVFVDSCSSVSGVAPLYGFNSFIYSSWIPVEPNTIRLLSKSLYRHGIDHPKCGRIEIFKHYPISPSIYRCPQISKLIDESVIA